uniref:Glutamine amidotransferase domain-containing protein n=3 Tax=Clytia hemisphaerica TaxID=252671 RepID=A0A7M5V5I8_9CNID
MIDFYPFILSLNSQLFLTMNYSRFRNILTQYNRQNLSTKKLIKVKTVNLAHLQSVKYSSTKMSPKKIGFIMTEDGEKWKGEAGIGKYFLQRFQQVDDSFEYEVIHGVTGSLPKISQLPNYIGFVISGSHHSVNDPYQWIMNLQNFIIQLDQYNKENRNKPVRLFGICYGHQLIAKTFGGVVQPIGDGKFIYGAEKVNFTNKLSDEVWFKQALQYHSSNIMVAQSHGEEVYTVPKNAITVASSTTCKAEALLYDDHILSFQGHPELENETLGRIIGGNLIRKKIIDRQALERGNGNARMVPADTLTGMVLAFLNH